MLIFEKYGGLDIVDNIIDKFYELALKSEKLHPLIKNIDISKFKKNQTKLLKDLITLPIEYSGGELYEEKNILNFSPIDYDEVRRCLVESMKINGIESEDIDFILTVLTNNYTVSKLTNDSHLDKIVRHL